MPKAFSDLQIRLIQVRDEPDMLAQEQAVFLERCCLNSEQLHCTNAAQEPLHLSILDDVDAVMIGGSGAYSVTKRYTWTDDLTALVQASYNNDLPLFGSCWGHQFIAFALGGTVIHDPSRAEMGCGDVSLTDIGRTDPLFADFPATFKANMGHQDRVSVLPPNALELATNDVAPNQAFRIVGKPIYGTQFHSELDAQAERERLFAYRDHYRDVLDADAFQRTLDSLAETTEVDGLLYAFLQKFAC